MKAFFAVLAPLLFFSAQAMSIDLAYPQDDPRAQGFYPIQLNGARCDSEVHPTSCDLLFSSSKGRIVRLAVNANQRSYTYISASNRSTLVRNVKAADIDLLLRLGVALENFGLDCNSTVIVTEKKKEISQIYPGCDI